MAVTEIFDRELWRAGGREQVGDGERKDRQLDDGLNHRRCVPSLSVHEADEAKLDAVCRY